VNPEEIAFIYYQKGESEAKLRFKKENAAVDLLKKIESDQLEVQTWPRG